MQENVEAVTQRVPRTDVGGASLWLAGLTDLARPFPRSTTMARNGAWAAVLDLALVTPLMSHYGSSGWA
jgi:hypothetical protein